MAKVGAAHQDDGDQERALAAEPVADAAEHQGAQRPEHEAGAEQRQRGDESRRSGQAGEEGLGDDRARLPKTKKSYHSKVVPADEAAITRAIGQGLCSAAINNAPLVSRRRDNGWD